VKLARLRAWIHPEVRDLLDGMGVVFAATMFFCLLQASHDGIVNRNRDFDSQRWWYPAYRMFAEQSDVSSFGNSAKSRAHANKTPTLVCRRLS
jgi:hypothetical protein